MEFAVPIRPIDPFVIGITVSAPTRDRNDSRSTDLPLPTTRHDRAPSSGMGGRIRVVIGDGDKFFVWGSGAWPGHAHATSPRGHAVGGWAHKHCLMVRCEP